MGKKWAVTLGILGLTIGLLHPKNTAFGVAMPEAIAYSLPWAIFFGLIGLVIDYFKRKK